MTKKINSDFLGMLSSSLCLIHCLALPIIIVFFGEALHSLEHLEFLDWIFAIISLYAAVDSVRKTHSKLLRITFITGWTFFVVGVFAHEHVYLSYSLHIGSVILIISHVRNYIINRRFTCEIHHEK